MAIFKENPVGIKLPNGDTLYNLENQVLKNKEDIYNLQHAERILANFGIRVVGNAPTLAYLPSVQDYKNQNPTTWLYGDAYTVGSEQPYDFYILTRADVEHDNDYWFNLGKIVGQQGPKGDKGDKGDQGEQGPIGPRGPQGIQGIQGQSGPRGEQGLQGIQGPKGETGFAITIIGYVNSTAELPTASADQIHKGYLIKNSVTGNSDLYIVLLESDGITWMWNNVGSITFSGDYVTNATYNSDKLLMANSLNADGINLTLLNNQGTVKGTVINVATVNGKPIIINKANKGGNYQGVQYIEVDLPYNNLNYLSQVDYAPLLKNQLVTWLNTVLMNQGNLINLAKFNPLVFKCQDVECLNLVKVVKSTNDSGYLVFTFTFNQVMTEKSLYQLTIVINTSIAPTTNLNSVSADNITIGTITPSIINIKGTSLEDITITDVPSTATSGTLTDAQLQVLQENNGNKVIFNNENYIQMDNQHTPGTLVYTHNGYTDADGGSTIKYFVVNIATKAWTLVSENVATKDYVNSLILNALQGEY